MTEIQHETRAEGGVFQAGRGGERAEMTYRRSPGGESLVFDHTYVPEHLRGQGLAEALVEAGVAFARQEGKTVVPSCSYVAALFRRRPERYADIAAR